MCPEDKSQADGTFCARWVGAAESWDLSGRADNSYSKLHFPDLLFLCEGPQVRVKLVASFPLLIFSFSWRDWEKEPLNPSLTSSPPGCAVGLKVFACRRRLPTPWTQSNGCFSLPASSWSHNGKYLFSVWFSFPKNAKQKAIFLNSRIVLYD